MNRIVVKDKSPYEQPITVYGMNDGVMEFCNHAGSEEQCIEFAKDSLYDGGAIRANDDSELQLHHVCDKCDAWFDYEYEWRDGVMGL